LRKAPPVKAESIIKEAARWLPVAWKLRSIFGGDKRKALAAIRKLELDKRKERDRRMRR